MNLGSKLNRVKQQADRLFLRGDKTDVFGELKDAEEKADELRILTEAFYRSSEKRLNTYHATDEKKHKKVPENQVADSLKDALKEAFLDQSADIAEKPLYRGVIEEIVGAELLLGKIVLDYEEQVETQVLLPIHKLLKEDFPLVSKQKKALKQAGQDVDAAKARFRNSISNPGQAAKSETLKCDLEEAEARLEQIKDAYACELFNTLGKQRDIAKLTCLSLEMKLDYLQRTLGNLSAQLPPLRQLLEESPYGPIYAVPLHEHLRISSREIAFPIEECVQRIIQYGLKEEGLFRVAGSSTKVKRLRGAFDAGIITPGALSSQECIRDYDIHVVAGALKSYLRDLPEPLLTHTRHDQWVESIKISDHNQRLKALWQVVNSLPSCNLKNLTYLIKFLALLARHSNDNKMTSGNLAIVIAPNLIWCQKDIDDCDINSFGMNMTLSNDYRSIIEQLVEYSDYFFKDKVEFNVQPIFVTKSPRSHPKVPTNGMLPPGSSATLGRLTSHKRTGSADLQMNTSITDADGIESPKQPHRTKKKPAPKPPNKSSAESEDLSSSTNSQRSSPEPTRSHSPINHPLPAPRLHHVNSLRRPTVDPPRPPTQIKPPRPDPPVQESSVYPPLGFEKISSHVSMTSVDDNNAEETSNSTEKEEKVELRDHHAGPSDEFRKSLEGVLKHPHTLPRHLTRPNSGEATSEERNAVHLPGFPVPVQRTSKEIDKTCKPSLPEKPTKVIKGNDVLRPTVPDKPTSLGAKNAGPMKRNSEPLQDGCPDDNRSLDTNEDSELLNSLKTKNTDLQRDSKPSDSTQL